MPWLCPPPRFRKTKLSPKQGSVINICLIVYVALTWNFCQYCIMLVYDEKSGTTNFNKLFSSSSWLPFVWEVDFMYLFIGKIYRGQLSEEMFGHNMQCKTLNYHNLLKRTEICQHLNYTSTKLANETSPFRDGSRWRHMCTYFCCYSKVCRILT